MNTQNTTSQHTSAFRDYLPLAVMACPQHAGKHPFHDQRWIVTAGTTAEHGYDPRPDQWHTVGGSLVAEMRDVSPGLAEHIVHCVNSHDALVAALGENATALSQLVAFLKHHAEDSACGLGPHLLSAAYLALNAEDKARAALAQAKQ